MLDVPEGRQVPVLGRSRRSILVAAWAFAEATCWPIMPDAAVVPLAAARPADWWRLALAAAGGSTVGATMSYLLGRTGAAHALLSRLPLIRRPMVDAAGSWLATEGAAGLRHHPLSGVPIKVFALLAGARGVPLGPILAWALAVRGARFLAVAGTAALLGCRLEWLVRRHRWGLLVLWGTAFALGLWRTVVAWERRPPGVRPAAA